MAYSGGLDSTVLLHQLVRLREAHPELRLRAIHVHHGISPNADRWAAHCQALCHRWEVPFELAYVELAQDGLGLEAQARKARYQAFAAALLPGEALVTAQHLDDQCETLLLALKRGSGPAGLAAMPAELPFADSVLLRPLLNTGKGPLETFTLPIVTSFCGSTMKATRTIASIATFYACAFCLRWKRAGRTSPRRRRAARSFVASKSNCWMNCWRRSLPR
ncbi:tRNA(Ile)-lysidine synthetase [Cronobacter universalis NCTC 9529]|nr:tRNA(Ile)-lysidine synthetase [Cronobacter universalis NCTC 9529]